MIRSFFIAIVAATVAGLLALAQPIGTNTIPPNRVPLSTVANLPACNASNEGLVYGVTDQATAVAYNGAVTGSGATHQKVYCNNTAWVQQ